MSKPALFVGSSSEGLDLARAVRTLLVEEAEVTLWNEGFFGIGDTFIESLVTPLPQFDFAALVLTPDDLTTSREVTVLSARDNVLFELGLFMGRLGRSRTFVLRPRAGQIRMPSDLAGLSAAVYDWPRDDRNPRAAMGPACDSIREMIRSLGFSETKMSTQLRAVQDEQVRERSDLQSILRFLLENFVTEYELHPPTEFGLRRTISLQAVRHVRGRAATVIGARIDSQATRMRNSLDVFSWRRCQEPPGNNPAR